MIDPRVAQLAGLAHQGSMTRRDVLHAGLKLGIATSLLTGLLQRAPETLAAPVPGGIHIPDRFQDGGSGTFTALISSSADDADPHSTYSTIGSMICLPCYEMLIRYKGDTVDDYEPMLAESWQASDDLTSVTFTLFENIQ